MNDTVHIFRTVTLRPHWFQYVINEFVAFLSWQHLGMEILLFPIPRVGNIRWHSFIPLSAVQTDISGKDGICDNRGTDYHHAWCSVPLYRLRRVV